MKREPETIEHDPNEKRHGSGFWWSAWLMVIILWVGAYFTMDQFNWEQIALGGGTVGVLVVWAMEITGNKVPESWRK